MAKSHYTPAFHTMNKRSISTPSKHSSLLTPKYVSITPQYAKELVEKQQRLHVTGIRTRNSSNTSSNTRFPLLSLTCWEVNAKPSYSDPSTDVYTMCTFCSNFICTRLTARAGTKFKSHTDNHPLSNQTGIPKAYQCCTLWVPIDEYVARGDLDDDSLRHFNVPNKKAKVTPSPTQRNPPSSFSDSSSPSDVIQSDDDDDDYSDCSSIDSAESGDYDSDDISVTELYHMFQPRVWNSGDNDATTFVSVLHSTKPNEQEQYSSRTPHFSPSKVRHTVSALGNTIDELETVIKSQTAEAKLCRKEFDRKLSSILLVHQSELANRDAIIASLKQQSSLVLNETIRNAEEQSRTAVASYNDLLKEKEAAFNKGVNDTMKAHTQSTVDVPDSLDPAKIGLAIEEMCSKINNGKHHKSTRAAAVSKATLFHAFHGACRPILLDYSRHLVYRNNPYRRAEEIARVMDTEPGALNLSGYHSLRQGMELRKENGKIPHGGGMLASVHPVKTAMKKIEKAAEHVIPYQMLDPEVADGFEFDNQKTFLYLVKLLKLREVALDRTQPSVQWAFTLDGVKVSRNISIIIAGMKVTDVQAIDPKTGEFVEHFQSPYLCFPLKAVVMDDNKQFYDDQFSEFFSFFKNVEEHGIGDYEPGAFSFASPQDGKSLWQSLKRGGACKNATYFCHCCACTSDHCYRPKVNKLRCSRCRDTGLDKCFHWSVGDAVMLQRTQLKMDAMSESYPYLANPAKALRRVGKIRAIRLDDTEVGKERVPSNLSFVPANKTEKQIFSSKINRALKALKIKPCDTSLRRRTRQLRRILERCSEYSDLAEVAQCCEYAGALVNIRQAIPCILHLENRVGEKIVRTAILQAISRNNMSEVQQEEIIRNFQHAVNTKVLGTTNRMTSWRLPVTKDSNNKKVIADMTMTNQHVRKFMYKFSCLSSVLFPLEDDQDIRAEWDTCIESWIVLMEKARQREDFDDDDIEQFQMLCDEFIVQWFGVVPGKDGVTNYIHMIAAGHLTYYMREWKNLYRFSQQGWEGLNSIIKQFLHTRTQGGGGGKKDGKTSKVKPIARWCQRRLFFCQRTIKKSTSNLNY